VNLVQWMLYQIGNISNKPVFRLFRFHPGIRACQLYCHVRNKDVQTLAA
jgi:hypothetical protein